MKILNILLIASIMSVSSSLTGYDIFNISYNTSGSTVSDVELIIPEYNVRTVEIDGSRYSVIDHEGGIRTNKKGFAEIPYITASVQLNNNKNVKVDNISSEYIDISLKHPLLPSKGIITRDQNIADIPYQIAPGSVKDSFYPKDLYELTEPFIFRNTRGVNIIFYPFRYNSEKNILRVHKKMLISVTEVGGVPINPLGDHSATIAREMESVYRSFYINYNHTKSLTVGDKGDILVIYTPENGGLGSVTPYINWKKQSGHRVRSMEVPNGTDLDAENIVRDAYNDNPDLLFVQLVGDWENLRSAYSVDLGGSKDPVLGNVSGNDEYQDLIIGRFSAKNAEQLENQINKGIKYELYPEIEGEWYSKALALASNEGAGIGDDGESDEAHNEIINDYKLLPSSYSDVFTAYQSEGAGATQISNYINQGVSLINYTGHGYIQGWGGPGFSNSNINYLSNGDRLPFIVSVACVTGHFSGSSDCFAEAWLKKENGGAIAGWFATINQPWQPPMRGQDYFSDILTGGYDYSAGPGYGTSTGEQRITFGSVCLNSAVLTLSEAPTDPSTKATVETWTVFGDAALQLRRDSPKLIENENEVVFIENYSTGIVSNGLPVEGATVSLFQDGSSFFATTDSDGQVSIDHDFFEGNALLTVSGFNLAPSQIEVPVMIPEGPYLKVDEYIFSSKNYGENSSADISIKNIGVEESSSIEVHVSADPKYITMVNDNYDLTGIILSPDSVYRSENTVNFLIDSQVPDQERIEFDVTLTDSYAKKTYRSNIYLTVDAPDISISHITDAETVLQGDDQEIIFLVQNNGHSDLKRFTAGLSQETAYDVGVSDPVTVDSLPPGTEIEIPFICSYGNDIINSSKVDLKLSVVSDSEIRVEHELSQVVGITENFGSGDFLTNNWEFSGDKEWVIDSEVFYDANYSASSGDVENSENATLAVSFDYIEDGKISFFRKVSSETNYDKLNFYINGSLKGFWSGDKDWQKFSYDVTAGQNEFKWTFVRDASDGAGLNKAWIDNILATGILVTGINNEDKNIPSGPQLYQNYPNPFNPVTQISFALTKRADVRLSVYNISGQQVAELINGLREAGDHVLDFEGAGLNSGLYYYTLESDGKVLTKKMLLLK
ncbi:MAG: C25 family cysteine peptidase [Candidatus Delongbacteria bacterium]